MTTARAHRAGTPIGRGKPGTARPSRLPITLYDLITAVQVVVGPGDDRLVVATVRHILQSRRLTGLGTGSRRRPPPHLETGWSHSVTGAINVKSNV
jgi:hypothetical protein